MKENFDKINIFGKNQVRKMRRLSRLEKFINLKSKNYLQYSIIILKSNVIKSKLN